MAALRFSTPASGAPQSSWPGGLSPIGPPPPRRRSRLQEKAELRQLNDRLAAYIEGVRGREAARAALQRRLAQEEEEVEGGEASLLLRQRYDGELAEVRRLLDNQAAQRAALQLELGALREQHRQLRDRNAKKESDLNLAVAQLRETEARLRFREGDLATALSRQRSLEKSLQETEDQVTSLKKMVKDAKNQLQDEKLKRIDLENQTQTLQEQMMFLKNLHKDELKRKKSLYDSKIKEIESGHQQELRGKLLDALHALRQEHEQLIVVYKEQVERKFAAKVENAQISASKNSDLANSTREELMKTKLRTDLLTSQNAALETRISELEATARELEKTIDRERDTHRRCVAEKNREMAEARQQLAAQLEEHEQLLDAKLALDLEIHAYRVMLEREETRLGLSMTSLESITGLPSTASQSHLFLRGKKRKRTVAEKRSLRIGFTGAQHASSSGSILIEEIDVEGKFVRIRNISDQNQSLSGWTLRREHKNESDMMYQFPTGFTLQAGQRVTIWHTREEDLQEIDVTLLWKSQKPWESGENVSFTLLNAEGEETAERKIVRVAGGGGGDYGREGEEAAEEEEEMELYTRVGFLDEVPKQNGSRICPII